MPPDEPNKGAPTAPTAAPPTEPSKDVRTRTTYSIDDMEFAAYPPIVVESGPPQRIRMKISIGIAGALKLNSTAQTKIEFFDLVSQWEIATPHVTCQGDRKSVEKNASYLLLEGTDTAPYVEFVCPRTVASGEEGKLTLILRKKSATENGLYEYSFDTPTFP